MDYSRVALSKEEEIGFDVLMGSGGIFMT